jgi:hypothetical protein
MSGFDALDKVRQFLDKIEDMPLDVINIKVKEMETPIYELFNRLERLQALSPEFQQVDMSEDIYALCRMLERKQLVKKYPLLSRAAGLL